MTSRGPFQLPPFWDLGILCHAVRAEAGTTLLTPVMVYLSDPRDVQTQ